MSRSARSRDAMEAVPRLRPNPAAAAVGPREPLLIDRGTLESRLAALQGVATDPVLGLFGPASMTWQVSRESLCFLGAGRALLLQLAHPWVAQAIEDLNHSNFLGVVFNNQKVKFGKSRYQYGYGYLDQAKTS